MAKGKQRARRYPQKSAVMNFRITPGTRRLLEQAAAASGRTLSAECEHQLQRALSDLGQGPSHALMALIARTIDGLVRMRERGSPSASHARRWWDDPYTFDMAARAVITAFDLFRPKEQPPQNSGRHGEFAIEATIREIQLIDLTKPFDQMTPHQRWLALLKRDLGALADRPIIWGEDAQRAREVYERANPILRELIPLSKKAAVTPNNLTAEEEQRLQQLRQQLDEIRRGEIK